ncbi:hypothetical protein K488DRAFT_71266 [Vararia minispora EC-137]|uniref:Uncharacterized protein n=1 Tax=Vararia minispora EC-137 TaxID=1314806 RepID=A0ACB8QIF8_9AGAM|nr:hypothetical protein K488DRAFT_71266 [Vararia minispora EC-137]
MYIMRELTSCLKYRPKPLTLECERFSSGWAPSSASRFTSATNVPQPSRLCHTIHPAFPHPERAIMDLKGTYVAYAFKDSRILRYARVVSVEVIDKGDQWITLVFRGKDKNIDVRSYPYQSDRTQILSNARARLAEEEIGSDANAYWVILTSLVEVGVSLAALFITLRSTKLTEVLHDVIRNASSPTKVIDDLRAGNLDPNALIPVVIGEALKLNGENISVVQSLLTCSPLRTLADSIFSIAGENDPRTKAAVRRAAIVALLMALKGGVVGIGAALCLIAKNGIVGDSSSMKTTPGSKRLKSDILVSRGQRSLPANTIADRSAERTWDSAARDFGVGVGIAALFAVSAAGTVWLWERQNRPSGEDAFDAFVSNWVRQGYDASSIREK